MKNFIFQTLELSANYIYIYNIRGNTIFRIKTICKKILDSKFYIHYVTLKNRNREKFDNMKLN